MNNSQAHSAATAARPIKSSEQPALVQERSNEARSHHSWRPILLHALRASDLLVMTVAFASGFVVSAAGSGPQELSEFLALRIRLSNIFLFVAYGTDLVAMRTALGGIGRVRGG